MNTRSTREFDITILGAGILGTCIAYWLSVLYENCRIVVLEKEDHVAPHTSSRNTGVIHRPFYLDPVRKKNFARAAQLSYGLWRSYAHEKKLPWKEVQTLEVALKTEQIETLKRYKKISRENGMLDDEVQFLTQEEVKKIEPNVKCEAAILCKTDTAVSYGMFTESLKKDAEALGVEFIFSREIDKIEQEGDSLLLSSSGNGLTRTKFLINCAGGNAVDIAHLLDIAKDFTDIHLRGEYWFIDPSVSNLAKRNIYSVPQHSEFPFLDPHWIVRWDGQVEIGPSAVPVVHPYLYKGIFGSPSMLIKKIFERPVGNKIRLFTNSDFLSLAWTEWKSSFMKKEMARRVQQFLPDLRIEHLQKKGNAGIRSSVIHTKGNFVKEALELEGPHSFHILNYNSPGATGAPAFAASIVQKLREKRKLGHLPLRNSSPDTLWNFESIISSFMKSPENSSLHKST